MNNPQIYTTRQAGQCVTRPVQQDNSPRIISETRLTQESVAGFLNGTLPAGIVPVENNPAAGLHYRFEGYDDIEMETGANLGSLNLPGALALLDSLASAVAAFKHPEARVFWVFGELHTSPMHIAGLQAGFLASRKNAPLAIELPYNGLADLAKYYYNLDVPPEACQKLTGEDVMGHSHARAVIGKSFASAPVAVRYRLQTALCHNRPVIKYDTSRTTTDRTACVNMSDPVNREIALEMLKEGQLEEDWPEPVPDIPCTHSDGMNIRNRAGARRIVSAMTDWQEKAGVTEMLINAGNAHLGQARSGRTFDRSLQAQIIKFAKPHDIVVTIRPSTDIHNCRAEKTVPPGGHPRILPVHLHGLSEREMNPLDYTADLAPQTAEQEMWFDRLRDVFKAQGQTVPEYLQQSPISDYDGARAELESLIERAVPGCGLE